LNLAPLYYSVAKTLPLPEKFEKKLVILDFAFATERFER
jgi:hypothetical protein